MGIDPLGNEPIEHFYSRYGSVRGERCRRNEEVEVIVRPVVFDETVVRDRERAENVEVPPEEDVPPNHGAEESDEHRLSSVPAARSEQ